VNIKGTGASALAQAAKARRQLKTISPDSHTHSNKTVLDQLTDDGSGKLKYKGAYIVPAEINGGTF